MEESEVLYFSGAPKGDEKLTGFSGLHKSIFHPIIDSRLEGRFPYTVARDRKLC